MKTIKPYLVLYFLLGFLSLHSQDISINLSIRWSEGPYILNTDSIVRYPELVVSYTNNSQNNLYFRKFSYYRNGIPDFGWEESFNGPKPEPEMFSNLREWNKKRRDYKNYIKKTIANKHNDSYYVMIGLPFFNDNTWFVIDEDSYDAGHGCANVINRDFRYINEYLSDTIYNIYDERNEYKLPFGAKDITKRAIKNKTKDQFMFLKTGETKEDVFNLTCFDIVKGTYTFIMNGSEFSDKVFSGWDAKGNKILLSLPEKVGKYKLYSGKFTSNSITVKFE